MKRVLISLFLLAALLTSVAEAQAPSLSPSTGQWLLGVLERKHGPSLNMTREEFVDDVFANGQIFGIGQVLLDMKLACPGHDPTVGEIGQVVENGIRANPKAFYSAGSGLVIAALLQRNYPCKETQQFLPRVLH